MANDQYVYLGVYMVLSAPKIDSEFGMLKNFKHCTSIDVDDFKTMFGVEPLGMFFEIRTVEDYSNSCLILKNYSKYFVEYQFESLNTEIKYDEILVSEFEKEFQNYLQYYKFKGFEVSVKYGLVMYNM